MLLCAESDLLRHPMNRTAYFPRNPKGFVPSEPSTEVDGGPIQTSSSTSRQRSSVARHSSLHNKLVRKQPRFVPGAWMPRRTDTDVLCQNPDVSGLDLTDSTGEIPRENPFCLLEQAF